jgi:hypothetical protein
MSDFWIWLLIQAVYAVLWIEDHWPLLVLSLLLLTIIAVRAWRRWRKHTLIVSVPPAVVEWLMTQSQDQARVFNPNEVAGLLLVELAMRDHYNTGEHRVTETLECQE